MKPCIVLAAIVACGSGAILLSQRRKVDTPASPDAVLHFIGDAEHELTRVPMKLTRLSDTEEIQIGDALAKHYGNDWKPESKNDQDFIQAQAYVGRVGARVASSAHRKLPYRFHYIPWDSFVNAFALPGGHVFIGAGLVELMDSEDELAAVLGHEVEHIDLGHCAERVQIEARLRKLHLQAVGSLIDIPATVFEAGYGKEQELAADREGTRLSVAANYSPNGAVRMFEIFQRLDDERQHPPKSPQEELTLAAQNTIEDYFRTHPPSGQRAQQIRDLILSEAWNATRSETDLQIGYIYWTREASRQLSLNRYDKAIGLSKRSLGVQVDYMPALRVLAEAYFLSASFPEAAAAYGRIVQHDVTPAYVRMYADSLAAARPASAAQEYQQWLASHSGTSMQREYEIEMAGLKVLNGNDGDARRIVGKLTAGGNDPEMRGRLGWWYYRAGNYDQAHTLLERAVEERPQIQELQTRVGWVLIEHHQLETALSRFRDASNRESDAELRMGRAVAQWQAQDMNNALSNFTGAATEAPYWLNPRWVQATRSPLVVRSIAQLQAERERRARASREKRLAH